MSTIVHEPFISNISSMSLDPSSIAIRGASLTTIINTLEHILSEMECCTKFEYKRKQLNCMRGPLVETAKFDMEYGTRPKAWTLDHHQREIHFEFMNFVLPDAIDSALEKFPHNAEIPEEFDPENLPGPPIMRRDWCRVEINILFNQPQAPDAIILEFHRLSGDHNTKHWVSRYVTDKLHECFAPITTRYDYLSLMEGCPEATGHIAQYLFDENVARDICSYMENPTISYLRRIPQVQT